MKNHLTMMADKILNLTQYFPMHPKIHGCGGISVAELLPTMRLWVQFPGPKLKKKSINQSVKKLDYWLAPSSSQRYQSYLKTTALSLYICTIHFAYWLLWSQYLLAKRINVMECLYFFQRKWIENKSILNIFFHSLGTKYNINQQLSQIFSVLGRKIMFSLYFCKFFGAKVNSVSRLSNHTWNLTLS